MRLDTLPLGARFRLPVCGLTGTLVRLSEGGATVRYDGESTVQIGDDVMFQRSRSPVVISSGTDVEPLPHEAE